MQFLLHSNFTVFNWVLFISDPLKKKHHITIFFHYIFHWPVNWSCRIHQLHLCREVRPHPTNKCPGYYTKPSDGKAPVLELWGMGSTPSLPLLPGPLWPGVVVPYRVLSMGHIELFNHLTVCKQMTDIELNFWYYVAILETI